MTRAQTALAVLCLLAWLVLVAATQVYGHARLWAVLMLVGIGAGFAVGVWSRGRK